MKTRVRAVDVDHPEPEIIEEAAAILSQGGLVAFATETVYGLGADATNAEAVGRIFEAKGRPSFNPLIVHVEGVPHARTFTTAWTESAQRLADRFWPGPLTLIVPKTPAIPAIVTAGGPSVGLRVPAPKVARALIARVGAPLAAPSANRSNRISPTCAEHVLADLDGRIDLILDSGPTTVGLESTVLDLTSAPARILRPGPIGWHDLAPFFKEGDLAGPTSPEAPPPDRPSSPGMLAVHYAPRTRALRVESVRDVFDVAWPERAGVLAFERLDRDRLPEHVVVIEHPDPIGAAQNLYASLHALDAQGLDLIVVAMPPAGGAWDAVRDRLRRATTPLEA
ncbi:L-threonylcarbamoyladenylate synthase [Paludisphaera borealis]|uniref:Threonylcarbamoyl-AMP synthase n=1 Tax=Paludisphaera borealis TaxID=1387353 RepID=A0A1U7CVV5_9BACT|nr:L-threonylcarbamoyladenylate synthase [Paludisphaera borealis]APW63077.1 Threonylcarbamoyl-AMP synthase [Paludisphaera borealis]